MSRIASQFGALVNLQAGPLKRMVLQVSVVLSSINHLLCSFD